MSQAQKIGRHQRILGSKFYRKCSRNSQLEKLLLKLLPVATCPGISGQTTHNQCQQPLYASPSPHLVWVTCLQPSIWEERKELLVSLPWFPPRLELFSNREGISMLGRLTSTYLTNVHFRSSHDVTGKLDQSFPTVPGAEISDFSMTAAVFFLSITPHMAMPVSLPKLQGPVWVSLSLLLLQETSWDFSFLGVMCLFNKF